MQTVLLGAFFDKKLYIYFDHNKDNNAVQAC